MPEIQWAGAGDYCEGRINSIIKYWIEGRGKFYLHNAEELMGAYDTLRQAQDIAEGQQDYLSARNEHFKE